MHSSPVAAVVGRAQTWAWLFFLVVGTVLSPAQNFSDDFTRATNSVSVVPWQIQAGNWVITNGVFLGGENSLNSYGFTYVTNDLTNCTVQGKFSFPVNAFGGGLGARLNPATGAHYAAWIYPENSVGGDRVLKLVKFSDWSNFTQLGSTVSLPAVGTNFHTLAMVLDTNFISVYFDGALQINYIEPSGYYTNGSVCIDMYTYTPTAYVLSVDDVFAAQINYPPVSRSDLFTLGNSGPQIINAPGVLYNDTDSDSTNLSASLVSTTTNGALSLGSDGSFTYTLTNGASAYDSFSYQISDGTSTSAVANVLLTLTAAGTLFSDDLSRSTNPASLLPWTAQFGDWSITNSILEGGTNTIPSYGSLYGPGEWTDYAVEGSFAFPTNGYGGGIAGRVNPATGQRYAAWLYPDNSARGPNNIRVVKFQTWDAYGYNSLSNASALAEIHLDTSVGTNWHTLKLAFKNNLLSVYHNGTWLTNVGDFDAYTNPYPKGGIGVDFFSYTNEYKLAADNLIARTLVSDDSFVAVAQASLTVAAPGVITNDTGISGAALTAALVCGPANGNLTLNTNGGFTYTPATNFLGDDTFAYELKEGTNSLGAAIVHVSVTSTNSAPQLPAQPDYFVGAGSTLLVTNTAADANHLSYQLIGVPNGMSISTNGVITWTPTLAQSPSTNIVQTVVTDDGAPPLSSSNLITFVVTNPPGVYYQAAFYEDFDAITPPALPTGWATSQTGDQLIWFTQTALRDSLPNAAFSSEAATNGVNELVSPALVLPVGNFQLHFRNSYNLETHPTTTGLAFDGGVLEIKIGAGPFTDVLAAGGTFLSGGYTHTISSDFGNPLAGRSAWSGDSGGFVTTILALPSAASGATVQFRWRCGTDNATGGAGWAVDNVGITNVLCCNLFAPVLPAQGDDSISELVLLTRTNTATDGDLPDDQLSYSLTAFPSGAAISTNGVITWQPTEAQGPMVAAFTTVVTDKAGQKATNSFNITVTEVNVAPQFVALPANQTVAEGSLLTVTNGATDADVPANVLTYVLVNAPAGAGITTNGVITWTPGESAGPGTNTITTVVNDGTVSVTNSFEVVVTEVNVAPVATNDSYFLTNAVLTVAAGGILANDTDADLPTNTLTAVLVSGPANGVLNLNSNGGFTYTPNVGFSGLDVFTYRANDGLTNSAVATVSVTVSNRPFVITSVVVNAGVATVTWNSTPGLSYRVQYIDNLAATNWSNINPVVTATNISASVTNFVGSNPQRFYRVQIVETPQPVILSLLVTNGNAVITWSSAPTKDYRLQYKTNLTDLTWTEVLPSITASTTTTTTTNAVGLASQRFFRVRLMP